MTFKHTRDGDSAVWTSLSDRSRHSRQRPMSFELPRTKRSCNQLREKPKSDALSYTKPFLDFLTKNPTVFHAVEHFSDTLKAQGFTELSERRSWHDTLHPGGKYFVTRNGSSLIAFEIGRMYRAGNGAAIVASHVDALTARLKPISKLQNKGGYVQLGVAPYAGGLNTTWLDRDLGIAGRVIVKNKDTGKIETRLVKLDWPIARIPTLAPHFGAAADIPHPNKETQMVPIIGLENQEPDTISAEPKPGVLGKMGTFTATQPERLVNAIAGEMGIEDHSSILNWELELFDTQPAQLGGLDKELIFGGRIDDKLCAFSALEALIEATSSPSSSPDIFSFSNIDPSKDSGIIRMTAFYDDEEIGSLLRQGAHSNLLPSILSRICDAFPSNEHGRSDLPDILNSSISATSVFSSIPPSSDSFPEPPRSAADLLAQTYANSFLISADVTHAFNPNFPSAYLENHSPSLNTGVAIQADPNGHTTTDAISTALLQQIADKSDSVLQVFQIRNDVRSGGTVGPMISSKTGMRAIDAGLPQLSMHSIRATTGSKDPGLGVKLFRGFFEHFEEVDRDFQ